MFLINFIVGFILFYIFLFSITFIVTRISSVTMSFKNNKKEETVMVKIGKPKKEVKKTWNENLGVWEIE